MERVGPYELLSELARGGMGVVYHARRGEREVALKLLLPGAANEEELARFRQEARVLAQLRHPGIVRVFDAGFDGGRPYLAMELLDGESLDARLRRLGRLEPWQVAELGQRLASALEHAHDAGVVHRDLKPANVFMTQAGDPVLIDFGLARVLAARLTATGDLLGTPLYMAPEQAAGERSQVGPATDVYGLGAVLYRCLTGEPPFTPQARLELVLYAILEQEPPPFGARCPQAPAGLEQVVLRCLAKSPGDRFASAGDLAEALAPFAGPGRVGERSGGAASGPRWLLALAALGGAVGFGVLAAGVWAPAPPPAPSPARVDPSPHPSPSTPRLDPDVVRSQVEAMNPSRQARDGVELLERLLRQDPEHAGAEGLRALVLTQSGRLTEAPAGIARALARDPGQVDALLARAYVHARDRQPERALALLARLAEREVQRPWFRCLMVKLWGVLGQREQAQRQLDSILRDWPGQVEVLELTGSLATQFGWLDRALELLDRAVALAPERWSGYFLRGTAWNINGDRQSALRDLNQAIQLGADDSRVYVHRAIVHMDLSNDKAAFRDLQEAERLDPGSESVPINRGNLYAAREEFDLARVEFQRALDMLGEDDQRVAELRKLIRQLSTRER